MEKSISYIADLIDDEVLDALGVKARSLRLARERNAFPSSWYLVLKPVCDRNGVDCPLTAFTFKNPSHNTPQAGDTK